MTPDELKAWRKRRDLTQREAAELIGVHERIYRGYENGEREVRKPVAALVRMLQQQDRESA